MCDRDREQAIWSGAAQLDCTILRTPYRTLQSTVSTTKRREVHGGRQDPFHQSRCPDQTAHVYAGRRTDRTWPHRLHLQQLATDRNGTLVSRDFQTQAQQVFGNLKAALAAVGATFKDVVKISSYLPISRTRRFCARSVPAISTPRRCRPRRLLAARACA
jgi:hypothetical protein